MEFISEADFERTGDFPAVEYRLIRSARTVGGEKTAVYSLLCISRDDDGLSDEAFIYDVSSDPEDGFGNLCRYNRRKGYSGDGCRRCG